MNKDLGSRRAEVWDMLLKLRDEVLQAAQILRAQGHGDLANNILFHTGGAMGVISIYIPMPDKTEGYPHPAERGS